MYFILPSGTYYDATHFVGRVQIEQDEDGDDIRIPVSPSHYVSADSIECAERPSHDHVLADNWEANPMNPAVCWRERTPPEDRLHKRQLASLDSLPPVMRAFILGVNDGTITPGADVPIAELEQQIGDNL